MQLLNIYKSEERQLILEVTKDNEVFDLSGSTLELNIYDGATAVITKLDADFDKTEASDGIVKVFLTETETDIDLRKYKAKLTIDDTEDYILEFIIRIIT